jgi:hypothetical protein
MSSRWWDEVPSTDLPPRPDDAGEEDLDARLAWPVAKVEGAVPPESIELRMPPWGQERRAGEPSGAAAVAEVRGEIAALHDEVRQLRRDLAALAARVGRDLDGIVEAVVERLQEAFEVVPGDEPAPPPPRSARSARRTR